MPAEYVCPGTELGKHRILVMISVAVGRDPATGKFSDITNCQDLWKLEFRRRGGKSEAAMKKFYAGALLMLISLFAQTAAAAPCTLCDIYHRCDTLCEHCFEGRFGPGLWVVDGYCWGEEVSGTCGDFGPCREQFQATSWSFEPAIDSGEECATQTWSSAVQKPVGGSGASELILARH